MNPTQSRVVLAAQRTELTESEIYRRLADTMADAGNADVLRRISADELGHHDLFAKVTGVKVRPRLFMLWWYLLLARLLGVTFALKLMELGEQTAQVGYEQLQGIDGIDTVIADEERHENELIDMLKDERLEYAGSVVLGLNDALVELTGALAGMTLALADTQIVAAAGLVTGIAASLSMAASEYLASKSEGENEAGRPGKKPLTAAVYTGSAYIFAVILLVAPYFVFDHLYVALASTLIVAVVIIAVFNAYLAVARDLRFWPRFGEMAGISLGVAALSFGIGYVVREALGLGG